VPNPFKPKMLYNRTVTDIALIGAAGLYLSLYIYVIISYFKKADLKN